MPSATSTFFASPIANMLRPTAGRRWRSGARPFASNSRGIMSLWCKDRSCDQVREIGDEERVVRQSVSRDLPAIGIHQKGDLCRAGLGGGHSRHHRVSASRPSSCCRFIITSMNGIWWKRVSRIIGVTIRWLFRPRASLCRDPRSLGCGPAIQDDGARFTPRASRSFSTSSTTTPPRAINWARRCRCAASTTPPTIACRRKIRGTTWTSPAAATR